MSNWNNLQLRESEMCSAFSVEPPQTLTHNPCRMCSHEQQRSLQLCMGGDVGWRCREGAGVAQTFEQCRKRGAKGTFCLPAAGEAVACAAGDG